MSYKTPPPSSTLPTPPVEYKQPMNPPTPSNDLDIVSKLEKMISEGALNTQTATASASAPAPPTEAQTSQPAPVTQVEDVNAEAPPRISLDLLSIWKDIAQKKLSQIAMPNVEGKDEQTKKEMLQLYEEKKQLEKERDELQNVNKLNRLQTLQQSAEVVLPKLMEVWRQQGLDDKAIAKEFEKFLVFIPENNDAMSNAVQQVIQATASASVSAFQQHRKDASQIEAAHKQANALAEEMASLKRENQTLKEELLKGKSPLWGSTSATASSAAVAPPPPAASTPFQNIQRPELPQDPLTRAILNAKLYDSQKAPNLAKDVAFAESWGKMWKENALADPNSSNYTQRDLLPKRVLDIVDQHRMTKIQKT